VTFPYHDWQLAELVEKLRLRLANYERQLVSSSSSRSSGSSSGGDDLGSGSKWWISHRRFTLVNDRDWFVMRMSSSVRIAWSKVAEVGHE